LWAKQASVQGMEISPGQCRAARALLNWTQDELATKVGVALRTIRDFENERRQPLKVVRSSIQQAFEQAGIEFLESEGIRLKK
jgi:DNA-binding XRE family transcriptional regulator